MRKLLKKEMILSASPLTYFYILFGLMFFLPGYPILCGAFFVALGIFQSYRNMRETNDILFSVLLPVAKREVVKGKFIFTCFIEMCGILLMCIAVAIRATQLVNAEVYRNNALMNANGFALAMAFVIFGWFNYSFIGGYFKTTYRFTKPMILFISVTFLLISVSEILHHIPTFSWLNAFGTDYFAIQMLLLVAGIIVYAMLTFVSYFLSCRQFEKIDL